MGVRQLCLAMFGHVSPSLCTKCEWCRARLIAQRSNGSTSEGVELNADPASNGFQPVTTRRGGGEQRYGC